MGPCFILSSKELEKPWIENHDLFYKVSCLTTKASRLGGRGDGMSIFMPPTIEKVSGAYCFERGWACYSLFEHSMQAP